MIVGFRVKATGDERWAIVRSREARDPTDGRRLSSPLSTT